MHPETKKLTQKKHALSNTNTDRKSKATAKPYQLRDHVRIQRWQRACQTLKCPCIWPCQTAEWNLDISAESSTHSAEACSHSTRRWRPLHM